MTCARIEREKGEEAMLTQQEIQRMLAEIQLDNQADTFIFAEFDNWTKLSSKSNSPKKQTFIEITATTVADSK